jgi:hypothetical protein
LLYFIHLRQWLRVLYCWRQSDRKIVSFLSLPSSTSKKKITLCSHQSLYHEAWELHRTMPQAHLWYMDADRWYSTYNTFQSTQIDPYRLLDIIDQSVYHSHLINHVYDERRNSLLSSYIVWMGRLFVEASAVCHEQKTDSYVLQWWFANEIWFRHTASWLIVLNDYVQSLCADCDLTISAFFLKQRAMLVFSLHHTVTISSISDQNWHLWFVISRVSMYVDFHELDLIRKIPVHYGSLTKSNPIWGWKKTDTSKLTKRSVVYCNQWKNTLPPWWVFIISIDKKTSARIRNECKKYCSQSHWDIEAENISSGYKKIVSRASQPWWCVMIGGYALYLSIIATGIYPQVYEWYITWPLAETVRTDAIWYRGNQ